MLEYLVAPIQRLIVDFQTFQSTSRSFDIHQTPSTSSQTSPAQKSPHQRKRVLFTPHLSSLRLTFRATLPQLPILWSCPQLLAQVLFVQDIWSQSKLLCQRRSARPTFKFQYLQSILILVGSYLRWTAKVCVSKTIFLANSARTDSHSFGQKCRNLSLWPLCI